MMSVKIQKKYRFLGQFLPHSTDRRLVILTGARQTGKTTLVGDQFPHLRYISLDAPENRETLQRISTFSWGKDVGNAILDEVQKEPSLFEKIKYAYDEGSISFSLLLGSSQILLLRKIRESLAGRVSIFELWPLLTSEVYWDAKAPKVSFPLLDHLLGGENISDVLNNIPSILIGKEEISRREVEDYLLSWGGMPALLPLSEEERWKWLKDYEYTYLERDLSDLARLNDLAPFRKFQKLSALRSACLLNYAELARDAGVSVDTARRYLEYLNLSYQVILLQPYYRNITSSVVKTPKLYWLDIGILRQLCGFRGEVSGEIYETWVVAEIVKWIRTTQKGTGIYFYRTRSGLELDLILQTEKGILGIEIKNRSEITSSDFRPMREVAEGLGKEWQGGIVVYRGQQIKKLAEPNLWALPSCRLFI